MIAKIKDFFGNLISKFKDFWFNTVSYTMREGILFCVASFAVSSIISLAVALVPVSANYILAFLLIIGYVSVVALMVDTISNYTEPYKMLDRQFGIPLKE